MPIDRAGRYRNEEATHLLTEYDPALSRGLIVPLYTMSSIGSKIL